MREFWDARAAEDAFYFVDNRLRYRAADEQAFWSGGRDVLDAIVSLLELELRPGDHVVEIGCGVGRLTRPLSQRVERVQAVDVSARMLTLARERNSELENVDWLLGDGTSLAAVESASIDACISYVVFQHIPDPAITLGYVREIGRVLRPGGWAAIQISNRPDVHEPPSLVARARLRMRALLGRGPRGQDAAAWLGSAIDLVRLRDTAAGAGLEVERVVGAETQHCLVLLRRR
jgi:SAM-dependent methyltransferase